MDREKVVKGLECHADRTNLSCRPSKCPYFSFDFCGPLLANDALALLKEQEAVEPVEEFIKGTNRHKYHCKRCGNIVGTILDDKHPIFPGVKLSIKHFCDVCGQAVKWG